MVLLAIVVLVVFGRLCACDFTWWDDHLNIQENAHLNPPTLQSVGFYFAHFSLGLYVPVTYLVWIGIAKIAMLREADSVGVTLNPWFFHGANVLVHVITSLIVFQILRRLVARDVPALIGALFWALHPVQVETVGWISGMKDLLAGCFGLIALWRYIIVAQRVDAPRRVWLPDPIGSVALLLAILSKPSAVTIPAIAMAIDWLLIRRSFRIAAQSTLIWWVLCLPFLVIARMAQGVEDHFIAPIWARPFIAGDALAFYFYKLVMPWRLGVDYGQTPEVVMHQAGFYIAWLAPAAIAGIIVLVSKRRPWLAAAGMCFFIAILPVSGLATFQFQDISTTADHYLYVALLGPSIAIAFVRAIRQARVYALGHHRSWLRCPLFHLCKPQSGKTTSPCSSMR